MVVYMTMNWSKPCSVSPETALTIRAGKSPACSTGRRASTIRGSTSPETRPRCMPRTATSSCFWLTTLIRSRRGGCRTARPTSTSAASIAGTPRSAQERSGSRASISGRSARIATFVEDFEEITIRHSKFAASRFAHEATPALTRFANSSSTPFLNGIKAARERIVARTDEDRTEFLRKRRFSKSETTKVIETVLAEEGRKPESIFDFVQGITAVARDKPHQDARLDLEARAKKLLERAA